MLKPEVAAEMKRYQAAVRTAAVGCWAVLSSVHEPCRNCRKFAAAVVRLWQLTITGKSLPHTCHAAGGQAQPHSPRFCDAAGEGALACLLDLVCCFFENSFALVRSLASL